MVTPILNSLSRAYLEFYTQNGREPDYFAMSEKMSPAFIEEASPVMRYPEPVYSTAAFRGIPIIELPLVEGAVAACGDPTRMRRPFVIDSTTQGQEAR